MSDMHRGIQIRRTLGAFTACCLASGLFACASPGSAGGPSPGSGSSTGTGGGATSPGSGGAGGGGLTPDTPINVTNPDGTVTDCAATARPPTPLRRLTRFEYNNTVQDLFGTEQTPADSFPEDEVSDGFSNNAVVLTVSSLHAEKYTFAAEELAAEAVSHLDTLLPCDPITIGETECAQEFAQKFGRRVYRRPLESDDLTLLMEAYALGGGFEHGIEIMLRTMLQSPDFLFRVEFTGAQVGDGKMYRLNGYEVATRLSFLLWGAGPSEELLNLAEQGGLDSPDQVLSQARTMLSDARARRAIPEFFRQWFKLNRLEIITKDATAFPLWSEELRAALIQESNAVLESIVFGPAPTISTMLTSEVGMPVGPLAGIYGLPESSTVVATPAGQRSGILSLPGVLAVLAHPDQTSPVLRGSFVRQRLLCHPIDPPPDDVVTTPPVVSEDATARERFSAHATSIACKGCHDLMDPLGFPFESYDALGTYRTSDGGRELDLSGEFISTTDMDGAFHGVPEMGSIMAESRQVSDCATTQWFKYAMGRSNEAGDVCSLNPLSSGFAEGAGNLQDLFVATTQTEAFLYRKASEAAQ